MTGGGRGPERLEGPSWVRRGRWVEAPLLLEHLPPEVPFGFVGRLLPPGPELRLDLEIHPVAAPEALRLLESSGAVAESELARHETGEGGRAAELALEAESARDLGRAVAARRQELFRVGISFRARAGIPLAAARGRRALAERLSALDFRTRIPSYEAGPALEPPALAYDPRRPRGYWHALSTDGAAAFFPFLDEAIVEPQGILVGLLLDGASPVVLDRYAHASHSWGLFGATGAGKTFAAALWALRTRWRWPELELFVLDPLGEFAGLAEALGGTVVGFGPEAPGRWHPLDPGSTGGDRSAKAARVAVMLRALFPSLTDDEAARLDGAVGRLYAHGAATPRFADLRSELAGEGTGPGRFADLLEPFLTGSLRHLDAPAPSPGLGNPTVFDLHGVSDSQLPFHLAYVLDGLYRRLRTGDHPKLVLVDEAQLLARSAGTAEFLDGLVRHVRHYRTGLLLMSQSPEDFLAHEAGRSLLTNLRATFLLRLPKVSDAARSFFDLTEAEAEWIPKARLPREHGYSEGLLRFGTAHLPIAVAASTAEYRFLTGALRDPPADAPLPVERHV